MFGSHVSHRFLLDIANQLSQKLNISIDRDTKRRKLVLVKWFEEHWDSLSNHVGNLNVDQENG